MKHKTFVELMDEQGIQFHETLQDILSFNNQRAIGHWVREGSGDQTWIENTVCRVNLYEHNAEGPEDEEIITWLKSLCLIHGISIGRGVGWND